MDAEVGKFIGVFVMVILPLIITLWAIANRFEDHDEEIMELKKRINKLDDEIMELKKRIKKLENQKYFDKF